MNGSNLNTRPEDISPEPSLIESSEIYTDNDDTYPGKEVNISPKEMISPSLPNLPTEKVKPKDMSFANAFRIDDVASSSSDDEYETPQKEPYEDKYIKLTTIEALDFLVTSDPSDMSSSNSDAVLLVALKVSISCYSYCLITSLLATILSYRRRSDVVLPWYAIFLFITVLWGYCLLAQGSLMSLKAGVTFARRLSMGITMLLLAANIFEGHILQNIFVYYGSTFSLLFYVILDQFLEAYQKENFRKQALLRDERVKAQKAVYAAIDRFSERKGLYLRSISSQLRDTTDLALCILKQLSPPNFLSKPHEQLSACSISLPTTSISAIHTTLKAINYVATHLGTLSLLLFSDERVEMTNIKKNFDIGETLQNIGDSLAGVASSAMVELAIYHVDYGLHHLNVVGDEAAFRHALLDLLKTILEGATPGACVEVGLQIRNSVESDSGTDKEDDSPDNMELHINPHDKVTCTVLITHNVSKTMEASALKRRNPILYPDANLITKMFSYIGATLVAKQEPGKQLFEINLELEAGPPLDLPNAPNVNEETRKRFPHWRISGEPSVLELSRFSQSLRGLKVALHATTNSSFAKHLTSCLTTWGTDISHVPIGDEEDIESLRNSANSNSSNNLSVSPPNSSSSAHSENYEDITSRIIQMAPPTFIIIDDDAKALKEQLTKLRNAPFPGGYVSMLNARGRQKRNQQVPHLPQQTTAVIHFTSLANFKHVKDTVQLIFSPTTATSFPLPQVLVIPKPAGPRRFLTALHTASNKIVVDPVYMPIATSPMSPGQQYSNGIAFTNGYNADLDSNPLERDVYGDVNSVNAYFPSEAISNSSINRSNTPSPSSSGNNNSRSSGSNVSPLGSGVRSGPGGGILIIPIVKNNIKDEHGKKSEVGTTNTTIVEALASPKYSPTLASPAIGSTFKNDGDDITSNVDGSICTPTKQQTPLQSPPLPQSKATSPNNRKLGGSSILPKSSSKGKVGVPNPSEDVIPAINVLIVEDNPINQTILSAFMRKKKIKYEVASNGQEAVDKWKKGGYHLILMDIQLPVMDGIEATKEIRRLEKEKKIGVLPSTPLTAPSNSSTPSSATSSAVSSPLATPNEKEQDTTPPTTPLRSPVIIVALTASSLSSDRKAALAAGCNDFLTKPVSLVWLEKKIKEWGCMQLLIDFEGWRKYKQQKQTPRDTRKAFNEFSANDESVFLGPNE